MRGWTTALVGSAMVAIGGFAWAAASFAAGSMVETLWCGAFGVGFLAVFASLLRSVHRLALAAALLVSAIPSFYWAQSAAAFGAFDSPWFLFGNGICGAAATSLTFLLINRLNLASWCVRAGLGVAALATFIMVVQALDHATPWIMAEFLVLAGLIVLVVTDVTGLVRLRATNA